MYFSSGIFSSALESHHTSDCSVAEVLTSDSRRLERAEMLTS